MVKRLVQCPVNFDESFLYMLCVNISTWLYVHPLRSLQNLTVRIDHGAEYRSCRRSLDIKVDLLDLAGHLLLTAPLRFDLALHSSVAEL